jgi:aspartyl-tRNA(Asn)/glutamyl-tRNA(Gln) amidotransferase subunit A
MALAGLGTDTTGSLRVPAALCGIVGLRPTLGSVPTDGVVPLAFSYDVVGPLAKTVADASVLWDVLKGDLAQAGTPGFGAVVLDAPGETVEPAIAERTRAIAALLDAGPIKLPAFDDAASIHSILQTAEAAAAHADWYGRQQQRYSPVVRERLERGRSICAVDYIRARSGRQALADLFLATMTRERAAAMLTHTSPIVAPRLDGDEAAQRASLLQAVLPLSQTGGPVLAIPAGADDAQLPCGVQLAGVPGDELNLFRIAMMIENQLRATSTTGRARPDRST